MMSVGNAFAWDGQRQGFVLGAGLGPGLSASAQAVGFSVAGEAVGRETKLALNSDWQLGYAPTNVLQISWISSVSWFELEHASGDRVIIANGLRGVAVTYYFHAESPSPLLVGGIGFSSWSEPFEEVPGTMWGVGFIVGAGYEVSPHWSIEGKLAWKNSSRGVVVLRQVDNTQDTTNALSLGFTVHVLGY
jgi:hypothetical protein